MDTNNNNNNNEICGIDKFEGSFDKEELGVTIILNASINEIRNPEALGLYAYLLARPPSWKLNVKHLCEHFQCGQDRMYRILNLLLEQKFISKKVIREKGKFIKNHYRVHLSRFSPHPENPEMDNPGTYKTKKILNKEKDLKPSVDSSKSTEKDYKENRLFMLFYKNYPNKQKPVLAYRAFLKLKPDEDFTQMLVDDLNLRMNNNWIGRDRSKIPFPATYLNGREWEGDIYPNEKSTNTKSTKYKSWDEIVGDYA